MNGCRLAGAALAVLLAAPAAAETLTDFFGPPLSSAFILPERESADKDRARWSLPEAPGAFEARTPPRLRFNGRKVKLRVPIG